MNRAYYSSAILDFCKSNTDQILGEMIRNHGFDLTGNQRDAWIAQACMLQKMLVNYQGSIHFEFSIPRMGKRIDVVLLIGPVIFVVEFKVGEKEFLTQDLDQVTDYVLDLKNFHEGSHHCYIVPILVADGSIIDIDGNSFGAIAA